MNTNVIDIQLGLFFKTPINRPDKLISDLNKESNDFFDTIPKIMPEFENAPIDIPIVQIQSVDEDYKCQIAKSRIDLFFKPKKEIADFSEIEDDFSEKEMNFIKAVFNSIKGKTEINRVGYVIKYFVQDTNPADTLKDSYISKPLQNLTELSIRYNKNNIINDFSINDITILNTGSKIKDNDTLKGLVIQRDINNIIDSSKNIDIKFMEIFLEVVHKEFSRTEIKKLI